MHPDPEELLNKRSDIMSRCLDQKKYLFRKYDRKHDYLFNKYILNPYIYLEINFVCEGFFLVVFNRR